MAANISNRKWVVGKFCGRSISSVHNNIDVSNYFPQVFNWFLKKEILKKKPKNSASIFNAITVIF